MRATVVHIFSQALPGRSQRLGVNVAPVHDITMSQVLQEGLGMSPTTQGPVNEDPWLLRLRCLHGSVLLCNRRLLVMMTIVQIVLRRLQQGCHTFSPHDGCVVVGGESRDGLGGDVLAAVVVLLFALGGGGWWRNGSIVRRRRNRGVENCSSETSLERKKRSQEWRRLQEAKGRPNDRNGGHHDC